MPRTLMLQLPHPRLHCSLVAKRTENNLQHGQSQECNFEAGFFRSEPLFPSPCFYVRAMGMIHSAKEKTLEEPASFNTFLKLHFCQIRPQKKTPKYEDRQIEPSMRENEQKVDKGESKVPNATEIT